MNIAVVTLTASGAATAWRLRQALPGSLIDGGRAGKINAWKVDEVRVYLPRGLYETGLKGEPFDCSTLELLGSLMHEFQGIICIMAAGIVVRAIGPRLQGKAVDPAVVVLDEEGKFAISLLSGHLGGANDLARNVAKHLGGTAVITTATDVQGHVAVDVLARDLAAKIEPVQKIVDLNGAIASNGKAALLCEGSLPLGKDHPIWRDSSWQVYTGVRELWGMAGRLIESGVPAAICTSKTGPQGYLYLRPQVLVVGVGCRRGVPGERILEAIKEALLKCGRSAFSVRKVVSIEAKAEEAGIYWAAEHLGAATEFFPAEVLTDVLQRYENLNQSDFVKTQMGVGGVCEPASLAGSRQGKLILGKQAKQGVTVAVTEDGSGW